MPNQLFIVGDTDPTAQTVQYRLRFSNQIWLLEAIMQALVVLGDPSYWVDNGTASIDDAVDLANQAVESFQVDLYAIGAIFPFAGDVDSFPAGTLLCDGSVYLRTSYPVLYGILGDIFHDDADHFHVPDLRGNVPVGVFDGHTSPTLDLGDMGGEETHTLITAEIPSHTHIDAGHTHTESAAAPNATTIGAGAPQATAIPSPSVTGSGTASIQPTGGDGAHNNLQPYIVLNYLIVAE